MPVAPFPATTGTHDWVPTVFSLKMQSKFYADSVLPMISNTDYEGEISNKGDKVVIRTVPNISVADWDGSKITYPNVETSTIELVIDKAKYWSFKVDDIQKAQSDIDYWTAASKDASEAMRIAVDEDVLANAPLGAHADNIVDSVGDSTGSPVVSTADQILHDILTCGTRLDEKNIPDSDRFVVLPPWAWELLKMSDLKAVHVTGDGTSPLRNGQVGMIDRFKVLKSNLLYTHATADADQGKTFCLAGHPKFLTFASQYVKTETLRLEGTFGDGVRGLKVYGYKVVHPTCGVNLKLMRAAP